VNESFAEAFWGTGDPLGREIRSGVGNLSGAPWITVIGVVANLRQTTLEEKPRPEVFRPYRPGFPGFAYFAIRVKNRPERVIASARRILHRMDPVLSLEDIHTMSQRISEANAKRRFQTVLLSGFAGLAILIACAGLYGLVSYSVKQRTAEIGIRMALGGSQGQVLGMVLRQGVGLVAIGVVIGIGAALAATRLSAGWLYGVSATDPVTFVSYAVLLLSVAVCASLFPATAAARIDPAAALRCE